MRKYIWFLLGVLISFVFVSPSHAVLCSNITANCNELRTTGQMCVATDGNYYSITSPVTSQYNNPGWYVPNWNTSAWPLYTGNPINNMRKYRSCSGNYCSWQDDIHITSQACDPDPPAEPVECGNGVLDPGESGVDCGGECVAPDDTCTPYCPTGGDYVLSDNGDGTYNCDGVFPVNSLGLCQSGQTLTPGGVDGNGDPVPDECLASVAAVMASDDYNDPVPVPVYQPDYSLQVDEVTQSTKAVETVDNLDGTSTVTETSTTSTTINDASSPSKVTTNTITRIIDNTTGGTLSESASTVTSENNDDPTDPLDPGAFVGGAGHDPLGEFVPDSVLDQFTTRFETFRTDIADAPIYTPVANFFSPPDTTGKTSTLTIGMGSYGDAGFDLANYGNIWDKLGLIFLFLAGWSAMRRILGDGMRSNHV